ncbi:MAG: S9 family peptidase [Thermoplasmatales archaeon]
MSRLNVNDFYRMHFLGNINAVGDRIFFEIFKPSKEKNDYDSQIAELKGNDVIPFTRGNGDRNSTFDSKGKLMAYVAKNGDKSVVYFRNLMTGEDRKLWETDMKIKEMIWDRLSKGLFIIAKENVKEEDYRIIEKYPIYFNGQGFYPSVGYNLIHLNLSGKVRKLLKGDDEIRSIAVNPKLDQLAMVIRPEGWDIYDSKLSLINTVTSELSDIEGIVGGIENITFDSDGSLYFLFSKHERSVFESSKLFLYRRSEIINLSQNFDISLENSVNSDSRMGKLRSMKAIGGEVFVIATVSGRAGIYKIREGELTEVVKGNFSVDSFDISDGKIYFIAQSLINPQEIYVYDGNVKRLTNINYSITKKIATKPVNFKMKASDGKVIEGWLLKGKGKGTIMEIHGGPRTSYGEAFMFEFHVLNSSGFNVLFSNPRGSDSYGDDFALEIKEKYGERDYRDIMEVADYSIKELGVSGSMGVIGGSYGGFMVNWIIGHTDRFKAAVTDRSISDQISFYFSSDIGPRFNSDQIGGNPFTNLEHYWNKSPIKYLEDVKTPLLIVHSNEDFRCPVWQAYEMFTQLKRQGARVRMIEFKGENHDLSREGKPKNRVKRLEEIVNWFSENL